MIIFLYAAPATPTMILIMATSRGRGLSALEGYKGAQLHVTPGGKTRYITDLAIEIIRSSRIPSHEPIYIYFITGLPDLTTKKRKFFHISHRRHTYQEIIITELSSQIHDRVEKIIRSSASRIKQLNAIPIFATITPMSIQTWNKHRLHAHRTSHLNHFHRYQNMQDTIEEATLAINTTIHSINSSNKVTTPKLAQEIIYYRHGHLRTRYGKLPDGVHPNKKVLTSWTQTMKTIINKNTHTKSPNHTPPAPSTQTIIQPVQINPPSSPPSPPPVSDSNSEQGCPKRSWRIY